jgi:hypothetical protein
MNDFKKQFFRPRTHTHNKADDDYNEIVMIGPVAKKGSWRLWLLVAIFLLVLGGSVYALFFSDYFRVKQIEINGSTEEIQNDVRNMLTWETDYMITFNEKSFVDSITRKWDDLAGAEVTKTWPDKLTIILIPEVAKMVWKSDGRLYLINASGMVLGNIEEPERLEKYNDLPVVTDASNIPVEEGNKVVSRDFVGFVEMVRNGIDMSIKREIESYEVGETTFNLKVKFKDGFWGYFDTLRNPELQVEKLAIFLNRQQLVDEYIDLRVPGKVFYK